MTPKTRPAFRATSWHFGPPPFIGWWNASTERDERARRFWDGDGWSAPVYADDPVEHAQSAVAADAACDEGSVEWRGVAVGDMDLDELMAYDDAAEPAADDHEEGDHEEDEGSDEHSSSGEPGTSSPRGYAEQTVVLLRLAEMKLRIVAGLPDATGDKLRIAPLPSYRCNLTPSLVAHHAQA